MIEAEKVETIESDQRSAERIAKVINRAKTGDEGAAIAKRHVEALAKRHNTTPEKLEEAAAVASPTTYFQFTPRSDRVHQRNEAGPDRGRSRYEEGRLKTGRLVGVLLREQDDELMPCG